MTFAAPPLDSGDYAVAAWCPGCASASGGRAFSVLQVDEQIVPRYRRSMRLTLRTTVTPESCPVTRPAGSSAVDSYGNGLLSTWVPASGIISRPREADGSIFNKLGWIPARGGADQTLAVRGERLDGPTPPMRVRVNWGYATTGKGSWTSAVWFPSEGCWRLTGRVEDVSLTYVMLVRGT